MKKTSKKTEPKKKRTAGRPSKKIPKYIDPLLANLREGMSLEAAASLAGLHRRTVEKWRKDDEAFNEEFQAAIDFAEAVMIADIKRLGNEKADWRAIAWILERRFPERWSLKKEIDMNIDKKSDGNNLVMSMIKQASEEIIKKENNDEE